MTPGFTAASTIDGAVIRMPAIVSVAYAGAAAVICDKCGAGRLPWSTGWLAVPRPGDPRVSFDVCPRCRRGVGGRAARDLADAYRPKGVP